MAAGWLRGVAGAALAAAAILALASHGAAGSRLGRQAPADQASAVASEPEGPPAAAEATSAAPPVTAPPPAAETSAKPRLAPINYTQVLEIFDSDTLDEPEVVRKWRHMDRQMTDGVRALLKAVFPHIVSMASDAKVSGTCSGAILKWILSLRNLRSWAVKMLDATGKPAAGLLEGSLTMFGNLRQCLNVRAPDDDEIELVDEFREYFRGKYCALELRPYLPKREPFYSLNSSYASLQRKPYKAYEKTTYDELAELASAFHFVNIRADLCVPSLCARDDLQRVADFLAAKLDMRAKVSSCQVAPFEPGDEYLPAYQAELRDRADQPGWPQREPALALGCLLFGLLLALVLVSTLGHGLLECLNQHRPAKCRARALFGALSLSSSLGRIRNVRLQVGSHQNSPKAPQFLYAIRLLVLLWIFLAVLVEQMQFQFLRELLTMRDLVMTWPMQFLVNSQLSFDTLILLTAFTFAYSNINSNLVDLIKYLVAKYFRLVPSIMLLATLTMATPNLFGLGERSPIWHSFVDQQSEACKSSVIFNLFFLQNYLSYERICLPQTWIFCVEFQLSILAIPIVYLMNKNFDANQGRFHASSMPILTLILLAGLGCVANFVSIYHNSLPAAWFLTFPDPADRALYLGSHQFRTLSHLSTFAVGLLVGHLCRCQSIQTFSGRPYGRRCCTSVMWLTSLALMAGLVFGTHAWSLSGRSHLEAPLASALYGALAPLAWSSACSLILFQLTVPNEKDERSRLARALSAEPNLIRLGRLSFLAYLFYPYVTSLVFGAQEQAVFGSPLLLGHTFVGNVAVTFALALLASALVELPCRRLVKKLALGSQRKCSNLGIITRQLHIRDQNLGPLQDSYSMPGKPMAERPKQQLQQQQQHQQQLQP